MYLGEDRNFKYHTAHHFHSSRLHRLYGDSSDKAFDLAIVDPPYGIRMGKFNRTNRTKEGVRYKANAYHHGDWDNATPSQEYWDELFRVSKNQIIWGMNYFPLPPTKCFVFWYKQNPVKNFADGELAWTSFDKPALCFPFRYYGNLEGNTTATKRIHPTQKSTHLYSYLLDTFAKPGDTILDTHLGSASSAIAAYQKGYSFIGIEIDATYFENSCERFLSEINKPPL